MNKIYGKTHIDVKEAAKLTKEEFVSTFAGVLKVDINQAYNEIQKLAGNGKKKAVKEKPKAKPKPKKDSEKKLEGDF